jgi:hypothetical protein
MMKLTPEQSRGPSWKIGTTPEFGPWTGRPYCQRLLTTEEEHYLQIS